MRQRFFLPGLAGTTVAVLAAFWWLYAPAKETAPFSTTPFLDVAPAAPVTVATGSEPDEVSADIVPAIDPCADRYTATLRTLTGADPAATDGQLTALWAQRNQRAVERLLASPNPRQWVTALRLQEEPVSESQLERLANAVRKDPDDALLATELFDLCNGREANAACARFDTEAMLVRADPDNGQTWLRLAVHHANGARDDDTLDALERLASAPIQDTRIPQLLSQMELDLRSADGSMTYLERFFVAIGGVAKGGLIGYSPLFAQCKSLSATSGRWRTACLNAAKRIATDRSTTLQTLIGLSLQAAVEEATGHAKQAAATLARTDAIYAVGQRQYELDANTLLMIDSKVLEQFIDAWMIDGELAAQEQLIATAEAAVERGEFVPCNR